MYPPNKILLKIKPKCETLKQAGTHQSLSLIWGDYSNLMRLLDGTVGGVCGDAMNDFVWRGRTFRASELYVKYIGHFGDKRQTARQFPADFL